MVKSAASIGSIGNESRAVVVVEWSAEVGARPLGTFGVSSVQRDHIGRFIALWATF